MSAVAENSRTEDNSPEFAESFQFEDADIILRARGADFKVHTAVLSHVSLIFKDMFSLPRETSASQDIPVVEVTDDAQTLYEVLSLIYLNDHHVDLNNVSTLHRVLLVLRKYEMEKLQPILLRILEIKVHIDPVRTFAVACHVGASQLARLAAKEAFKWSYFQIIECDSPEISSIRAGTLCKLFRYHSACGSVAINTIRTHATQCPVITHNSNYIRNIAGQCVDCRQSWWNAYLDNVAQSSSLHPIQPDYKSIGLVKKFCPPTMNTTGYCNICSPVALMNLIELGEQLEREVQEAIEQVP